MHTTTTTNISDAMSNLHELYQRLDHASFIPQEELFGLLVAGSILLESLVNSTESSQFTDDEISFVVNLSNQINVELASMQTNNEEFDNG